MICLPLHDAVELSLVETEVAVVLIIGLIKMPV